MAEVVYTPKKQKTSESTKRIRLIRGDETLKEKWARCVKEAKLLKMKRDLAKIRICELALEACDIKWGGGGHWSGFENQTTVTKFAIEIGMRPKTLMEWLAVKRYIFDNLNKKYHEDFKWSILAKLRRNLPIKRDTIVSKTKITALYEDLLKEKKDYGDVLNIKKYLGHLKYSINKNLNLRVEDKEEIKTLCKYILSKI